MRKRGATASAHALEGLFIHFIPPTRFVGDRQIAILYGDGVALDEVLVRRFVVRMVLQCDEVRSADGEVNVHQRRQRAERVVWRHFDIVQFVNGRDLLLLEESASETNVRKSLCASLNIH